MVSEVGETKTLFRAAMRSIVPEEILNRRDKVGFDTPMREWMRHRILSDLCDAGNKGEIYSKLIDQTKGQHYVVQAFESGKPLNWQVWRIFNLIRWSQDMRVTQST